MHRPPFLETEPLGFIRPPRWLSNSQPIARKLTVTLKTRGLHHRRITSGLFVIREEAVSAESQTNSAMPSCHYCYHLSLRMAGPMPSTDSHQFLTAGASHHSQTKRHSSADLRGIGELSLTAACSAFEDV